MEIDVLKLVGALAGIIFTVVFGMIANKLFNLPSTVQKSLGEFEGKLSERLNKLDEESKLSHRRINVHDRISSKIIHRDFDSRSIAESGIFPDFKNAEHS